MKKVLSAIVAALVATSFSAVVFAAADVAAPAATPIATASPALEKKATPRAKRPRTMKKGNFIKPVHKGVDCLKS
jgi:hypothetical protein